jgi:hypothetical protein
MTGKVSKALILRGRARPAARLSSKFLLRSNMALSGVFTPETMLH